MGTNKPGMSDLTLLSQVFVCGSDGKVLWKEYCRTHYCYGNGVFPNGVERVYVLPDGSGRGSSVAIFKICEDGSETIIFSTLGASEELKRRKALYEKQTNCT